MKKTISSIKRFFRGVIIELKKVSWPSRKTVINHTLIVVLSSTIVIIIVSAIDSGLSEGFEYLLSLKN